MMKTTSSSSRLLYLDFLRGIAVLGLLTMNITSMGLLSVDSVVATELFSDKLVQIIQTLFLDGRFRSIFCLLFGIGLSLQFTRYQHLGLQSIKVLKSRLHWLFIFGLFHCVFVWSGDILVVYALSGLVVINSIEDSSSELIKRGFLYFLIGMAIQACMFSAVFFSELDLSSTVSDIPLLSYQELYFENIFVAVFTILTFPFLFMFYLCGVMFIGIALFRDKVLQKGFTLFQLWGLVAVTVLFSLADLLTINNSIAGGNFSVGGLSSISGLTMALLFWHWVLKSKCYDSELRLVKSVNALGRRALSFYILQSLVMTTMFRFIFPQWNIEFTLVDYFMLALISIPVQLTIAHYYDRYYTQGPLEYWWRHLVVVK